MKITVMSLFRDSESYVSECLKRLETLSNKYNTEFIFYENDSVDGTKGILLDWLKDKEGYLITETLNRPKFGSIIQKDRFIYLSEYRNKLIENEIESDYTFILDSDIIFDSSIIDEYLYHSNNDIAMYTSNTIQYEFPCVMYNSFLPSYYDSLALFDIDGTHCMTWSSNPFYKKRDIDRWERMELVNVSRAFGGAALIKTEVLNKVKWYSDGELEHWSFCDSVKRHGDIVVVPTIKPRAIIDQKTVNSITKEHIEYVRNIQMKNLQYWGSL